MILSEHLRKVAKSVSGVGRVLCRVIMRPFARVIRAKD